MRKREVSGVETQFKRILSGFMGPGLAVVAFVCSLSPSGLDAKQPSPVSDLSGARRASALRYPELPKEIQERITGVHKSEPKSPKLDPQLNKDWGLINIGFFEVF